jgi:hypothetical protein
MTETETTPGHDPGVVFRLRPYSGLPGDDSDTGHPHALVTPAEAGANSTLTYGSTKDTEAGAGAVRHTVNPRPNGRNPNGLTKVTHFYPGVLALRRYRQLPARAGYLGSKDLKGLRETLRLALGISEGCTGEENHLAGSWRGRIVRFTPDAESALATTHGVVVTAPRYSKAQSYQVIVPIYDGTGRAAVDPVVKVEDRDWLSRLGAGVSSALLFVPSTVSVRHKDSHPAGAPGGGDRRGTDADAGSEPLPMVRTRTAVLSLRQSCRPGARHVCARPLRGCSICEV